MLNMIAHIEFNIKSYKEDFIKYRFCEYSIEFI